MPYIFSLLSMKLLETILELCVDKLLKILDNPNSDSDFTTFPSKCKLFRSLLDVRPSFRITKKQTTNDELPFLRRLFLGSFLRLFFRSRWLYRFVNPFAIGNLRRSYDRFDGFTGFQIVFNVINTAALFFE